MQPSLNQQHRIVISNIKRIRALKGYSQEYMGLKMKISQNTFSKIELGNVELSIARLLQIAAILDVEINFLFEDPNMQQPVVMKSQFLLNHEFTKTAIHRVVSPCPAGLEGLMIKSA
jgi:transcriptional regulator with XRE-family HTH domain